MKKMFVLPAVFVLCVTAYAQRADFVTRLITADKATYGEVCYLSAVYQGFVGENASYEDALRSLAAGTGGCPRRRERDDNAERAFPSYGEIVEHQRRTHVSCDQTFRALCVPPV